VSGKGREIMKVVNVDENIIPGGRKIKLWSLQDCIERYTKKHGEVTKILNSKNLLGKDMFRKVYFEDGFYITFCRTAYGGWFTHNGGGRYGPRSYYTGYVLPANIQIGEL